MKTVILGVDGSEASDQAMEWVLGEAKCREFEVVVVSVAEMLSTLSLQKEYSEVFERLLQAPRKLMEDAVETLRQAGIAARGVVEPGRPANVIADMARKEKADMVVVGSLGKHAVDRLLLGAVSAKLVEMAPCTVVVVR